MVRCSKKTEDCSGKLKCLYCFKPFNSQLWLDRHSANCDRNSETTSQQAGPERGVSATTADQQAGRDSEEVKSFNSQLWLDAEEVSCSKKAEDCSGKLKCLHCFKPFNSQLWLDRHSVNCGRNSETIFQQAGPERGVSATTVDRQAGRDSEEVKSFNNQLWLDAEEVTTTFQQAGSERGVFATTADQQAGRDSEKVKSFNSQLWLDAEGCSERPIQRGRGVSNTTADRQAGRDSEEEDSWEGQRIGKFILTETVFNKSCKRSICCATCYTYKRVFIRRDQFNTAEQVLADSFSDIAHIIFRELKLKQEMRFSIILSARYKKYGENGESDDYLNYRLRPKAGRLNSRDFKFVGQELRRMKQDIKILQYGLLALDKWVYDSCRFVAVELYPCSLEGGVLCIC